MRQKYFRLNLSQSRRICNKRGVENSRNAVNGGNITRRSKSRQNATFIGEPRRTSGTGESRTRIQSCEIFQLSVRLLLARSFIYRESYITSPSPRARKNRVLCLVASGKMRSSPSALSQNIVRRILFIQKYLRRSAPVVCAAKLQRERDAKNCVYD